MDVVVVAGVRMCFVGERLISFGILDGCTARRTGDVRSEMGGFDEAVGIRLGDRGGDGGRGSWLGDGKGGIPRISETRGCKCDGCWIVLF
jgi:hypothetical protein